jgi:hypothetical protein
MNRVHQFLVLVLVCLAFVPGAARGQTPSVSFDQVSWGNGNGGYVDQNSQVGQVTIGLAGDAGQLTPDGSGGYYGYANVITSVSGGSNNNWAVQNLLVNFSSLSALNGSLATTADFDLGQTDGTAVGGLSYSLTLSAAPLALQPSASLSSAAVANETEEVGTESDTNSLGSDAGLPATDYVGAPAATGRGGVGTISGSETNVPVIAEAVNGCAPGAKARSIGYLAAIGSITITQTAQQVYGSLTNSMGTTANGTSAAGIINGSNAYFATNGLSLNTVLTNNSMAGFSAAINSLNSTGDVETWISWGYTVNAGTNVYRGAHAVFVSSITPITNSLGQVVRYQIRYIQDPNQGGGSTNNQVLTMSVFANGADANAPAGVQGQGIAGFFLENMVAVPEPSTVLLTAMGCLTLLWQTRRRRRGP